MLNQALAFRGSIQGVVSQASLTAFITSHPEQQATALYRLDTSQSRANLSIETLPCDATALTAIEDTLWLAGSDGQLYTCARHNGAPKALAGLRLGQQPVLTLGGLVGNRLAVLQAQQLTIIALPNGTISQQFNYDIPATTLAVSTDGACLVVGNSQGLITVYQTETADQAFSQTSTGSVHQGAVTALQFAHQDWQFYSAGSDKKLFLTHARGTLQPLDKGRNSNHDQPITAILLGKQRFFTGALDKSLKGWAYAGGQPVSLKQGLADIAYLSVIQYQDKPALLAACRDSTLRIVSLTEDERPTEVVLQIDNGYVLARQLLQSTDPKEREPAIALMASYQDKLAFNVLTKHFKQETDSKIREHIIAAAQASLHPHASELLETGLKQSQQANVRLLALQALAKRAAPTDLRLYQLALDTGFVDTGKVALQTLAQLAAQLETAKQVLIQQLQHKQATLRFYTLRLLESLYASDSPRASLLALQSPHTDLQRAALIRLYQRQLLSQVDVRRALLLAQEHQDAQLRHSAFLIAILSQPALAQALKGLDANLAHQLQELETFELAEQDKVSHTPKSHETLPHKLSSALDKVKSVILGKNNSPQKLISVLELSDYHVLLQGMSNRYADIGLMAALALAVLQDPRAFGLLLVLSQEADATIRAGVCRAFASLGQSDSLPTLELLLNDNEPAVRDAAFSALQRLQTDDLRSVQCGFAAQFADVHARSLKLLLDHFAAQPTKAAHDQALDLLKAALNDPFEAIRQEAYKACLNRQLGGDEVATLRLLLTSHFENLHQEVLQELMANSKVLPSIAWVEPLLLELFNDAFAAIRLNALAFALQTKKRFAESTVLAQAVQSQYPDVRQAALKHIQLYPSQANQQHLSHLLADEHTDIRTTALTVLIQGQQYPAVLEALRSAYPDVQVNAANALASWGYAQAYPVLLNLLQRPQPQTKPELEHWVAIGELALNGLHQLSDTRAFTFVTPFIRHEQPRLVKAAAQALPWISDAAHQAQLLILQQDERPLVRAHATIALALLGNTQAKVLLADSALMEGQISRHLQLAAVLNLYAVTPVSLQRFLLNPAQENDLSAQLVLASHELLLHADEPYLSTWTLSFKHPPLQLFCADLMVHYASESARWEYVRQWLIQSQVNVSSQEKWDIALPTLQQIATILVYGQACLKAQLLSVLTHLSNKISLAEWELRYAAFTQRYATEITAAEQARQPTAPTKPLQHLWHQQAFGAYLGLIRQENTLPRQHSLALRLKALRSLQTLALADDDLRPSVMSSLLMLLNHTLLEIRQFAFEALQTLGLDAEQLGHAATSSPQSDIARQGLQLLMQHSTPAKAMQLLQTLIQSDNELLAHEAYQLYCTTKCDVAAAAFALKAQHQALRQLGIQALAAHYTDSTAQQLLIEATQQDNFALACLAASHLVTHQHPQTVEVLTRLLANSQHDEQRYALLPLFKQAKAVNLAEYLVDYNQQNRLTTEFQQRLYELIADYRHPAVFERLLARLASHPAESASLSTTLLKISGYDQPILDYAEEQADRRWLAKQYPRHDALLITLFNTLVRLNYPAKAAELAYSMAWTEDKAADQALFEAIPVLAPEHLLPVIQAVAYRAEKRHGRLAGLVQVLTHKDPDIQFVAAEGLALNGQTQGFSLLMAAVDYQTNADYRKRAVLALGKSGDERALDKLLTLAQEPDHFLHEVAVEALGHMGKSEQAERIYHLLKSRLNHAPTYSELNSHTLKGLRWLNTLPAWQLIYDFILDTQRYWLYQQQAIELLRYHNTDSTRELLLHLLRTHSDEALVQTAYNTAQYLWQRTANSVSALDYALLQGAYAELDDTLLERIVTYAPTANLLQLIAADYSSTSATSLQQTLNALGIALLNRHDYSVDDILPLLTNAKASVVELAARLLARESILTSTAQAALESTLNNWYAHWQQAYRHHTQAQASTYAPPSDLIPIQTTLSQLVWSVAYHECFSPLITQWLAKPLKHERFLQEPILTALLAKAKLDNPTLLALIEPLTATQAFAIRALANQVLAKHAPQTALDWHYFVNTPTLLINQPSSSTLTQAARQAAEQAQVLPLLIAQQAVGTLSQIAHDEHLSDNVRLGAIEGLARILNEDAQTALQALKQQSTDKDIAQAAFKALRRLQRSRATTTATLGVQP